MELITNAEQAKAEIDLNPDDAASRKEVMLYVGNHHRQNVVPGMTAIARRQEAIEKQRDLIANVVNNLIDFLEIEGFEAQKDGHYRLNAQKFNAFVKKRAPLGNQGNPAPDA